MERLRRALDELKRRRMFRAVAAYGVAVFALLQVAETVAHGLHLPDWTVTAAVVGSAAGFPVVIALAWFFDLRGGRLTRTAPAPAAATDGPTAVAVEDGAVAPGAMTALLEQLAYAPEQDPSARAPLRPGDVVGRFELLREIGRGGFGVVFEARDRELGRLVALKTIRPRRGMDPAMLRAEAEAAAQLQHPNIVTVHDVGTEGGEAWIVLELLRGETLEDRLRRGPLAPEEALRVAVDVARGLAHAHRTGVVHRDLKPANVFLCDDGAAKILDFGLSRVLGSSGREGGTPAYMAPEQWRGEPQDARTDVFAAGVMLFETLAGARPYAVANGRSAALDVDRAPPVAARGAPPQLRKLLGAAIDPAPARRPADGTAWLEGLLAVQGRGARQRAARTGVAVGAAGVAAGLLALGAATWHRERVPEVDPGARIPVAVADVQNGTADPELNGLSGMLVTSLEQSRRLVVLTRSRMVDAIRQLGKEPPAVLDESLAREIGRAVGVRALLLATVHRFDDRYAIELRALDPVKNEYLFTLQEEGRGKASIPDLIDRLARGTRERLREGAGEVAGAERRIADLTTGNLAAYEHYFRARQAIDLRQFPRARDELRAALQIDPEFALAHLGVVVLDAWTHKLGGAGDDSEEQAHLATALRLADRLPERERLALLGWKATVDGRVEESFRLRDQAAAAYPQDKEAVFWAGDVRYHQGDSASAIPFFERALALDPGYRLAMEHIVRALLEIGRRDDALAWARRWVEAARDDESRRMLGKALLATDRLDEAREVYDGMGMIGPPELVSFLASHRRVAEAEGLARRALASLRPAAPPSEEDAKREREQTDALSNVLALQGRWREAREIKLGRAVAGPRDLAFQLMGFALGTRRPEDARAAVEAVRAAGVDREPTAAAQMALALALAGDLAGADQLAAQARASPRWLSVQEPLRVFVDAARARIAGRLDDAEASARALLEKTSIVEAGYWTRVILGEWSAQRGRPGPAVEYLQQALATPWRPDTGAWFWLQPRAIYFLAASYEQLGDRARAREHVEALLALWEHADPDAPLLAEARALRARVAAARPVAEQRGGP